MKIVFRTIMSYSDLDVAYLPTKLVFTALNTLRMVGKKEWLKYTHRAEQMLVD